MGGGYQAIHHPGIGEEVYHPVYVPPSLLPGIPPSHHPTLLHAEAGNGERGVQRGQPGLSIENNMVKTALPALEPFFLLQLVDSYAQSYSASPGRE